MVRAVRCSACKKTGTRDGLWMCQRQRRTGSPRSEERRYTPGSLVAVTNRDDKDIAARTTVMITSTLTPPISGIMGPLYRRHRYVGVIDSARRREQVDRKLRPGSSAHSNTQNTMMGSITMCAVSTGCQAFSAGPIMIQPSQQKRFSVPPSGLSLLTWLKCCHTLSGHGRSACVTEGGEPRASRQACWRGLSDRQNGQGRHRERWINCCLARSSLQNETMQAHLT